jgi:hypothetical protein
MSEWISVKDELPKEDTLVILYITNGHNNGWLQFGMIDDTDVFVVMDENTDPAELEPDESVLNWMAAPKLPPEAI